VYTKQLAHKELGDIIHKLLDYPQTPERDNTLEVLYVCRRRLVHTPSRRTAPRPQIPAAAQLIETASEQHPPHSLQALSFAAMIAGSGGQP
jgi:hypothetical protein